MPSNRITDLAAAGAFFISDAPPLNYILHGPVGRFGGLRRAGIALRCC
jgi:hypothetical protein